MSHARTSLKGRNAVVLGLGLTGFSLVRHLLAEGAHVRVADTRPVPPCADALNKLAPEVEVVLGRPFDEDTFAQTDLVAISPGIAKDAPAIAAAVERGAEIVGDIELFARALPAGQKVIAITGSNGKTTVTALTGTLCRAAGLDTMVAGNIGTPVLEALHALRADRRWPDVIVLELSSFQLETTTSLTPAVATVLNVTENHLDRYPGMDAYAAAKARIFAGGGVQVLNRDDPRSMQMRLPQRVVETFGRGVPALEGEWGLVQRAQRDGGTWLAHGGRLLLSTRELRLVGEHNALNALAALALVAELAPIRKEVLGALAAFEGLPHRMERVADRDGVLFVNDSKGTTVAATEVALRGLDRPVVLIAGGDGKGQDFGTLREAVAAHCRAVLLIGRDAPRLEQALTGAAPRIEMCGTLEIAVGEALAVAREGDVVLLSPACASLDQFENYVARGERFTALVRTPTDAVTHA